MKMPKGFHEGHTGNLACQHRDVTCCQKCAGAHPEIIEVYGQHFWVDDPRDRANLVGSMSDHERLCSGGF